jgi:tRNA G18 (ribose-2'-O)-methylase SpoU
MEAAYYTPKVEDIRIGYICQTVTIMLANDKGDIKEEWNDLVISVDSRLDVIVSYIKDNGIRTKFLDIEDFVSKGWIHEGIIVVMNQPNAPKNSHRFRRGNHFVIYDFDRKTLLIALAIKDVFSVNIQNFYCPSINEFNYITNAIDLR